MRKSKVDQDLRAHTQTQVFTNRRSPSCLPEYLRAEANYDEDAAYSRTSYDIVPSYSLSPAPYPVIR